MNKPTKPTNTLPNSFGGVKTQFSTEKIQNGYEAGVADIFGGANLNYWLDATGGNISYLREICDFIRDLPIAKTITVDTDNKLVYRDWLGGRNYGELVYSAIPISDSSLKLLDGSVLTYTGIYKNFIDYIEGIVSTYSSLFVTEATWQSRVATYGVCGKFVYDSVNKTVRLPKVTGIIEGTVDISALGEVVAAGLPTLTTNTIESHTHEIDSSGSHTHKTESAGAHNHSSGTTTDDDEGGSYFTTGRYKSGQMHSAIYTGDSGTHKHNILSSGSHTHTTQSAGSHTHTINWGTKSNTIQPQTVKMFVYIVVATAILKTDEVVNVDEIMSEIGTKANLDGTNMVGSLSSSAKSYFTRLALPSTVKTSIVIPTSGNNITAPADGYVCCTNDIKLTNNERYLYGTNIPVVSGDTVKVEYTTTDSNSEIIFVYAQGGM